MKNSVNNKNDAFVFTFITAGMIAWLWFSLILTLAKGFFPLAIYAGLFVFFAVSVAFAYKHRERFRISKEFLAVLILSAAFSVIACSFSVPTIFSGRDQGSYSSAAIHLAQNRQLEFSTPASETFFRIYGEGKALNFPGFNYTSEGKLLTQFPLGYIAWLASCFTLFGIYGLVIANSITLALFLLAVFMIFKTFTSRFYAIWGWILAVVSFPTAWFSKFTLTENLAWALFAILAFSLMRYLSQEKLRYGFLALAASSFFMFTRIEGFTFFAITLFIISFTPTMREYIKKNVWSRLLLPLTTLVLIFAANIAANLPFYVSIAKAFLKKFNEIFSEQTFANEASETLSFAMPQMLWIYGMLLVFLIGIISIAVFMKKRATVYLIPAAIAAPTFFYLIDPSISSDHPWMLRRLVFSIWPALLISAVLGIALIQNFLTQHFPQQKIFTKRYYAGSLFSLILLSQLAPFLYFAPFADNRGVIDQVKTITAPFSNKDLLLVSRLASGDSWSMLPEPIQILSGKNAAYFFNPKDISKIDMSIYENIYLIVSNDEIPYYTDDAEHTYTPIQTYTINTERLEYTKNPSILPPIQSTQTIGTIFKIETSNNHQ